MSFSESIARRGLASPWEGIIQREAGGDLEMYWLIKAVISVESQWNPSAVNRSDPSSGLMQVMPAANGGAGPPGVTLDQLLDPDTNITAGAAFLRYQMGRYPVMSDAVSAYNAGHSTRDLASGRFANQAYVDAVLTYYSWFQNNQGGGPSTAPPPPESSPEGDSGGFPGGFSTAGLSGGGALGLLAALGLFAGFAYATSRRKRR